MLPTLSNNSIDYRFNFNCGLLFDAGFVLGQRSSQTFRRRYALRLGLVLNFFLLCVFSSNFLLSGYLLASGTGLEIGFVSDTESLVRLAFVVCSRGVTEIAAWATGGGLIFWAGSAAGVASG